MDILNPHYEAICLLKYQIEIHLNCANEQRWLMKNLCDNNHNGKIYKKKKYHIERALKLRHTLNVLRYLGEPYLEYLALNELNKQGVLNAMQKERLSLLHKNFTK